MDSAAMDSAATTPNYGLFGQWETGSNGNKKIVPSCITKDLIFTSKFHTNGKYITCGLCYNYFPRHALVPTKNGRDYTFSAFSAHVQESQYHKKSKEKEEYAEKLAKKRKEFENTFQSEYGYKPTDDDLNAHGLLRKKLKQESISNFYKKQAPKLTTNMTLEDTTTFTNISTKERESNEIKNNNSITKPRNLSLRRFMLQEKLTLVAQRNSLGTNICCGILNWKELINEGKQDAISKYYKYYNTNDNNDDYFYCTIGQSILCSIFSSECKRTAK